jgi:hypothetical protein
MPESIPTLRNGTVPVASSPTRPRPWSSTRRIVLSFVAATTFVLGGTGTALACTTPPRPPGPPCGGPGPGTCPTTPPRPPGPPCGGPGPGTCPTTPPCGGPGPGTCPTTPPCGGPGPGTCPTTPPCGGPGPGTCPTTPPAISPTSITSPSATAPASRPVPPTPTEGTCTGTAGGGDTCHVVTDDPSFTG